MIDSGLYDYDEKLFEISEITYFTKCYKALLDYSSREGLLVSQINEDIASHILDSTTLSNNDKTTLINSLGYIENNDVRTNWFDFENKSNARIIKLSDVTNFKNSNEIRMDVNHEK